MNKKVTLKLDGMDGNAFAIMGNFRRQALREGWSQSEVDVVLKDAMSDDYDHLLSVIINHTQDPDEDSAD